MQRVAASLAFVACTACSFQPRNPGAPSDGTAASDTPRSPDAPIDSVPGAPADAAPTGCIASWYRGTPPTFTAATLDINVAGRVDRDPMLVDDETTLYFSSDRMPTSIGDEDIFDVSRASKDVPFQIGGVAEGSDVIALDDFYVESKVAFSAAQPDDMIYTSNATQFVDHLWHSARPGSGGAFAAGDQIGLDAVNGTGSSQGDPSLSTDGLRLYFSAVLTDGLQHIMLATRPTLTDDFGSGTEITELNSRLGDADPALTPGEQVIVFSSLRGGGGGSADIYYAVRDGGSGAFGSAQPLASINSIYDDADPVISADGCRIYFATDRANQSVAGDYDLWLATMVAPAAD